MALTVVGKSHSPSLGGTGNKYSFSYEEVADEDTKTVYTIYGDKGHGKTTMAMSLPGTKHVLSLDHKSMRIRQGMYEGADNIHVIDGLKHFIEEESMLLESSSKTIDWLVYCLGEIGKAGGTDWVIFDGLERLSYIAEMKMRQEGKIAPFGGISNLNLWKKRKLYMRHLHRMAMEVSRKGVVYTTYPKIQQLMTDDGLEMRSKIPSWIDIVMEETDIVLRAESQRIKGKQIFLAFCESSKRDDIMKTGRAYEVTDKGLSDLKEVEKEDGKDDTGSHAEGKG